MMWKHERNMSTISQEMHCLGLFADHRKDIKFLRTVLGIQDAREDDGPKKIWWFWRFRRCFLSCPSRDEVECNSFFLFFNTKHFVQSWDGRWSWVVVAKQKYMSIECLCESSKVSFFLHWWWAWEAEMKRYRNCVILRESQELNSSFFNSHEDDVANINNIQWEEEEVVDLDSKTCLQIEQQRTRRWEHMWAIDVHASQESMCQFQHE